MNKYLCFALFALSGKAWGQTPMVQWQRCLGGHDYEEAYCVRQTTDGGYIIAGGTKTSNGLDDVKGWKGQTDCWIVKLDESGAMEWQQCLGGSLTDVAVSIEQTTDGAYVFAATSNSDNKDLSKNYGEQDIWIVKLNSTGAINWQRSYGGSKNDYAAAIKPTTDGGYIVAGTSLSNDSMVSGHHGTDKRDIWVFKLNSTGDLMWQKSLGGSADDEASDIMQVPDGFVIVGISESTDGDVTGNHGDLDYWVVKLTPTGAIDWQKSLGGTSGDYARSVIRDKDGNYVIAGYTWSKNGDVSKNKGGSDYWIVKLMWSGFLMWEKTVGGNYVDDAYSIMQDIDSNYVIAGRSTSTIGDMDTNYGKNDWWIVKLADTGIIWQKNLGGTDADYANSIYPTKDTGYIIVGGTSSDDIDVSGLHRTFDYWVVKLKESSSTGIKEAAKQNLNIYPNPAKDRLYIEMPDKQAKPLHILIMNLQGQLMKEYQLKEGKGTIPLDLAKGIYLLKCLNEEAISTYKLVIE